MNIKSIFCGVILGSILLFILTEAIICSINPISINSGRTNELLQTESSIQDIVIQISKDPSNANIEELKSSLNDLIANRKKYRDEINSGKKELQNKHYSDCLIPSNPECFLKKTSEKNNLFIAGSSGILGAILFILLQIREGYNNGNTMTLSRIAIDAVSLIPVGMIVGLLALYILRGTKDAVLSQISDVVQVENPYGIAFASTFAGIYSERILIFLTTSIKRVTAKSSE